MVAMRPDAAPAATRIANAALTPRRTVRNARPGLTGRGATPARRHDQPHSPVPTEAPALMPAQADAALIPAPAADAARKPVIPVVARIRAPIVRVAPTAVQAVAAPMSAIRVAALIRGPIRGPIVRGAPIPVPADAALTSAILAVARIRAPTGRAVPTPVRADVALMLAVPAVAPIPVRTGRAVPIPVRVVADRMSAIRAAVPIIVAPATVGRMREDRVAIVRTHVRTAPTVPAPIAPGVPTGPSPAIIRVAGTMPDVATISIMTSAATSPTGAGSGT